MSPLSLTLMSLTVAVLSLVAGVVSQDVSLPAQSVYIQPSSFAVLGSSYDWRVNSSMTFDPSDSSAPIFQIFDPDFLNILGSEPSLRVIASNPDFAFAHEAPVWVPDSDEVFFTSNAAGHLGHSGLDQNNQMGKISLQEVAAAIRNGTGSINVTVTSQLELDDAVQMTNGGTGPYKGNLLIMNQGRGELPANMVAINPYPPYNVTVLLDNFFGRQFNSLNDVKVHPSGEIFFTDSSLHRGPFILYTKALKPNPAPVPREFAMAIQLGMRGSESQASRDKAWTRPLSCRNITEGRARETRWDTFDIRLHQTNHIRLFSAMPGIAWTSLSRRDGAQVMPKVETAPFFPQPSPFCPLFTYPARQLWEHPQACRRYHPNVIARMTCAGIWSIVVTTRTTWKSIVSSGQPHGAIEDVSEKVESKARLKTFLA
ncbi:hypothetical protein BDZ89DRAFT_1047441 [Hymenopellis radicata]|nr:hypothetical protein BDZ89DRAFT_1047441 [Hymenopellis radicata]